MDIFILLKHSILFSNLQQRFYLWPSLIKIDKFGDLFVLGANQVHKLSIVQK